MTLNTPSDATRACSLRMPTALGWRAGFVALVLAFTGFSATAQEAAIRKALTERLPNFPAIEEISRSPMPGLWEVRVNGSDIFYTDVEGNFLIEGSLIDTQRRRNLTEEKVEKLNAVKFEDLPLKDAFTLVRGDGKRRIAVFEDPNCGFCKRFERDMLNVNNVTVYLFLYPILGQDSVDKSRNIWCAKDRAKAWNDWMLRNQAPAAASCDTAALTRNVEFGKRYRITGTPTTIFESGQRVPGAVPAQQIESLMATAKN